ncbi:hypothetical protein PGH47_18360 [Streptomyces sp. HUAS 31]|uniref:hypothetical protein n=1 Tax=Streptomyces sp. HUAS 31 TaxID=3020055 RepID=UPI002305A830|nr:hypothetical protein [Streptomyces sp. HUAS 31]WCD97529.1 hypothetical protein PGH47_18360 [Streptomyces sp. HUAS 31]
MPDQRVYPLRVGALFVVAVALTTNRFQTTANNKSKRRQRSSIRPNGAGFQVRVYAGQDPLTKKDIYLHEQAETEAEAETGDRPDVGKHQALRRTAVSRGGRLLVTAAHPARTTLVPGFPRTPHGHRWMSPGGCL